MERIRIYQDISNTFLGIFSNQKTSEPESHSVELADALRRIQSELFFWGSDSVISAWKDLNFHLRSMSQTQSESRQGDLTGAISLTGRLIIAMRRDVGYPNTRITEVDYAKLTLADGEAERAIIEKIALDQERSH